MSCQDENLMTLKQGATFSYAGTIRKSDTTDWTGSTIAAQIRDADGVLLGTCTCSWVQATPLPATFTIVCAAATTATFPVGLHKFDFKITTLGGVVLASQTFDLDVVARITQ